MVLQKTAWKIILHMGCKPNTHVTSGLILLSSLNTKESKQTLLPEQKNARHGKTSFIYHNRSA